MEFFSNALNFALPLFILLIFMEMAVAKIRKKEVMNSMDTVSSLSSGITNTLFKIMGITVYIFSYEFQLKHLATFHIESKMLQYIIGFIVIDFYVYWWHRWRHEYNVLWNEHVIHHSSEEYNLPVALRQTVSDIIHPAHFLLLPAAICGISMDIIVTIGVVMLFGGFWYHTQLIDKIGFLEKIIITPSHHRIHHAINPIYIDKNYGGILVIWDKMFGTFQEELPDEKPVYGITRPVNTWNPIKINFLHISVLFKDSWRTKSIKDKLRIWFMPTGWRPADVAEKYPVPYIKDYKNIHKFMPETSVYLKIWAWTQLFTTFGLMVLVLIQIAELSKTAIFVYSLFIFFSVYSYTSLMDREKHAWVFEIVRLIAALAIIRHLDGWFSLDVYIPHGSILLVVYLAISVLVSLAFELFEFKIDNKKAELSVG